MLVRNDRKSYQMHVKSFKLFSPICFQTKYFPRCFDQKSKLRNGRVKLPRPCADLNLEFGVGVNIGMFKV